MSAYPVNPIRVNDKEYPVFVSEDGLFCCTIEGGTIHAAQRLQLETKVKDIVGRKRTRISLPFSLVNSEGSGSVKSGVVVGKFLNSRELICKWDDNTKGRVSTWHANRFLFYADKLSKDDEAYFLAAVHDRNIASKKIEEFIKKHQIEIHRLADEEIRKATTTTEEASAKPRRTAKKSDA